MAARLAAEAGLRGADAKAVRAAAELHDIGKLALPEALLAKPGPLDEQEWELVREHTLIGERIIAAGDGLDPVARIVRSTHERWDGDGYPDGLAGEDIPLAARIIAICDAYEAMTTTRTYRAALTHDEAVQELRDSAGTQFDPALVEMFIRTVAIARVRSRARPEPDVSQARPDLRSTPDDHSSVAQGERASAPMRRTCCAFPVQCSSGRGRLVVRSTCRRAPEPALVLSQAASGCVLVSGAAQEHHAGRRLRAPPSRTGPHFRVSSLGTPISPLSLHPAP